MSYSTSAWKNNLLSIIPGADWSTVDREIQNALREFCVQSGAWAFQFDPIMIREGRADYYLNPQPGSMIVYIMGYYRTDAQTDGVRFSRLRQHPSSPAYSPSIGVIRFVPVPDAEDEGDTFEPVVALRPFNSSVVPDEAVLAWYDVITDGVLGRMMLQLDKPWSDKVTAQYHLRRFRTGMSQARDVARRRYSLTESEWVFPPWA